MARAILLLDALAWSGAALAGFAVGAVGADRLERLLPPLSIDADALGRAVTAVAVALLAVAVAHAVVWIGLRGNGRWAWSAGVLLSSTLAMLFVALTAVAITSLVAGTAAAAPLVAGAIGAGVMAVGYAVTAGRLLRELGAGSAF